jgi:hypothetical protein
VVADPATVAPGVEVDVAGEDVEVAGVVELVEGGLVVDGLAEVVAAATDVEVDGPPVATGLVDSSPEQAANMVARLSRTAACRAALFRCVRTTC